MTINEMRDQAYQNSVDKGFHDHGVDATVGDRLMLMVSELAEALEEYRKGYEPDEIYYHPSCPDKPEGVPIELADCVIRIGDFCGKYGIDLEKAIKMKIAYNASRPKMHGGKRL